MSTTGKVVTGSLIFLGIIGVVVYFNRDKYFPKKPH